MEWDIEFTDEFSEWWNGLSEQEQDAIRACVALLRNAGPQLPRPYSDTVRGSRHANMKELRVQESGKPYRVLYAFDPRRCAILLIGGDKTGAGRWYEQMIPKADKLYDEHLQTLREEGLT